MKHYQKSHMSVLVEGNTRRTAFVRVSIFLSAYQVLFAANSGDSDVSGSAAGVFLVLFAFFFLWWMAWDSRRDEAKRKKLLRELLRLRAASGAQALKVGKGNTPPYTLRLKALGHEEVRHLAAMLGGEPGADLLVSDLAKIPRHPSLSRSNPRLDEIVQSLSRQLQRVDGPPSSGYDKALVSMLLAIGTKDARSAVANHSRQIATYPARKKQEHLEELVRRSRLPSDDYRALNKSERKELSDWQDTQAPENIWGD